MKYYLKLIIFQQLKMTSEEKHFYKLADLVNVTPGLNWNYINLSHNRNIYLEDIEKYKKPIIDNPIAPFSAYEISFNPNITLDFVLKYPNLKWDWRGLSKNIPIWDILSHPELPWDWIELISEEKIQDLDFILKLPKNKWNWDLLSWKLPVNIIFEHKELPWNYEELSSNKTVNMEVVKSHPEIKWYFQQLSTFINLKEIIANPDYKWNYQLVSSNPTLTAEYLLQNLDKHWKWDLLYSNTNVNFDILADSDINLTPYLPLKRSIIRVYKALTAKFILKYFDIFQLRDVLDDYDWGVIFKNGTITIDDVIAHPELIYDYDIFSHNTKLELWYVLANIDQRWNWDALSKNPSFSVSDILEGFEAGADWSYPGLSVNPNLTFDFIYSRIEKNWNIFSLSINRYNVEYTRYSLILRLQNNYLRKKKNITRNVLTEYIIKDLSNIITEY